MPEPGRLANILAYWRAVEMFDPPGMPRSGDECVESLKLVSGSPLPVLPWQPRHPRYEAGTYGTVWRHTVYGGIFDVAAVRAALGYQETGGFTDSQSALFAFTVDEKGLLVANSMAFSACAWATGRLCQAEAEEGLDGLEDQTSKCESLFTDLLTHHMRYFSTAKGPDWRTVVTDILGSAAARAVSSLLSAMAPALGGLAGSLLQRSAQPQADSVVHRQQPGPESPGLILPDVIAFAGHVADRFALPPGLVRPLELRVVSAPLLLLKDGSPPDPERVPLNSPIAPDLKRVAGSVARGDAGPALTSYLSPPLPPVRRVDILRDRPFMLRGLSPQAFPPARWPGDEPLVAGQQFAVNTIRAGGALFAVNGPQGTGKTAVLRDLIAAIVVERAGWLACLARPEDAFHALTSGGVWRPHRRLTGFEILVASSVEELFGVAWWRDEAEMHAFLRKHESSPPLATEWRVAVKRFVAAVRAERALAKERVLAWRSSSSAVSEAALKEAASRARAARAAYDEAVSLCTRAEQEVGTCATAARRWQDERHRHDAARPSGLTGRLGVGDQVRRWRLRVEELVRETAVADGRLRSARVRRDEVLALVDERRTHLMRAQAAAANLTARQADDRSRVEDARQEWGAFFPETWLDLNQEQQELASPWSDPDWSAARAAVFQSAVDLHRAFIAGAASKIRTNLLSLSDLLKHAPDAPTTTAARTAVWQTRFLVSPVISTTFATCGRTFEGLGSASLGWVLIDGQTLPQHAAGALWRARRAVVVGDPLRLGPISQVPGEVQERLGEFFGVAPRWLPSSGSAQTLADEQNRWGTYVGQRWVGAPLRVHRRCEQPMFDISNTMAYQGQLVYGTRLAPFAGLESRWLDVRGPAQGEALLAVLDRLGADLGGVYVLSPFPDVAAGCRDVVERGLAPDHIGTVHALLGKDADVVILVLGAGGREAVPGDLLNAAVSTARRRLFVIGSHEEWSEAPNFTELARRLPVHRWPPPAP